MWPAYFNHPLCPNQLQRSASSFLVVDHTLNLPPCLLRHTRSLHGALCGKCCTELLRNQGSSDLLIFRYPQLLSSLLSIPFLCQYSPSSLTIQHGWAWKPWVHPSLKHLCEKPNGTKTHKGKRVDVSWLRGSWSRQVYESQSWMDELTDFSACSFGEDIC